MEYIKIIISLFLIIFLIFLTRNNIFEQYQEKKSIIINAPKQLPRDNQVSENETINPNKKGYSVYKGRWMHPYYLNDEDKNLLSDNVLDRITNDYETLNQLKNKISYPDVFDSYNKIDVNFKENVSAKKDINVKDNVITNSNLIIKPSNDESIVLKGDKGSYGDYGITFNQQNNKNQIINFEDGKIIYNHENDSMEFETNNNKNMVLSREGDLGINGKLGIGNTNPSSNLDILGNDPAIKFVNTGGNGSNNSLSFHLNNSETPLVKIKTHQTNNSSNIDFYTRTPGNSNNNLESRLHIHNNGNVGIATMNPQSKLDVKGKIYTNRLCLGDVCIDEAELSKISNNNKTYEIIEDGKCSDKEDYDIVESANECLVAGDNDFIIDAVSEPHYDKTKFGGGLGAPGKTLKDYTGNLGELYFGHTNGGSGKANDCFDLCKDDPKCKSFMWRNSGSTCYLSTGNELIDRPGTCCTDHHPFVMKKDTTIRLNGGRKSDQPVDGYNRDNNAPAGCTVHKDQLKTGGKTRYYKPGSTQDCGKNNLNCICLRKIRLKKK